MFSDTFKTAWSNLEKAFGQYSFSQYHTRIQRSPRSRSTTSDYVYNLRLPSRLKSRFVSELSNARCKDNSIESFSNSTFEKHLERQSRNQILQLTNLNLGKGSAKVIAKRLKDDQHFVRVNLSYNPLGDQGALMIVNSIANGKNRTIIHLELSKCCITPSGFKEILPLLVRVYSLISLDLSYNHLSQKGSVALQQLIVQHGNLKYLNLFGTYCSVVKGCFSYLNLGCNKLTSTAEILSAAEDLQLHDNPIGSLGLASLSRRIEGWHILRLNLSNTLMDNRALNQLVEGLVKNNIIEELDLSRNNFPGQLFHLYALLSKSQSLRKLLLRESNLSEFSKLAEGLKENHFLEWLDVSGNTVGEFGAHVLSQGIARLKILQMNRCKIQAGLNYLTQRLFHSNCVQFEIRDNMIEDIEPLLVLLKKNRNLVKVEIALNPIHYRQQVELDECVFNNQQLRRQQAVPRARSHALELSDYSFQQKIVEETKEHIQRLGELKRSELEKLRDELSQLQVENQQKTHEKKEQLYLLQNELSDLQYQEQQIHVQRDIFFQQTRLVISEWMEKIQAEKSREEEISKHILKCSMGLELLEKVMPKKLKQLQLEEEKQVQLMTQAYQNFEQL